MKSLSKSIKTIICFMAFLFAGVLFAISPIAPTFLMSTNSSGLTQMAISSTVDKATCSISAVKIPNTKVEIAKQQKLLIPFLSDQQNYTVRLIDKDGKTVHDYVVVDGNGLAADAEGASSSQKDFSTVEVGEGSDKQTYLTLNNKNTNTYTLVYIVKDTDAIYYSKAYEIEVIGEDYVIDYSLLTTKTIGEGEGATTKLVSTGLNQLFPSSKKLNSSFTFKPAYSHPKVEDDVEVEYTADMALTPKVVYNGEKTLEVGADDGMLTYDSAKNEYTINFKNAGKYTIEFTDSNANNRPTDTNTINVTENEEPTVEDIVKTTPELPTNVQLGGKDYSFNTPTLKYENGDVVDYNIKYIKFYKKSNPKIYQLLENNTLKFDMTIEAFKKYSTEVQNLSYKDLVGAYSVVYEIEDAYGHTYTYTPFNNTAWDYITVKDNPKVYMTYDYTAFDGDNYVADVDTDKYNAITELKTKYGYSNLIFPALYAEDLVESGKDLLVVRYFTSEDSVTHYIDNVRIENGKYVPVYNTSSNYNHALTQEESDALWTGDGDNKTINIKAYLERISKSAKFAFNDPDSLEDTKYTLHYQVVSRFNDTTRTGYLRDGESNEYTFTVVGSTSAEEADIAKLKVNIEDSSIADNKQVKVGEEYTIKITSSDELDARLKNILFYYTGVQAYSRPSDAEDEIELTAGTTANLAEDIQIVKQAIINNRAGSIGECNILEDELFKTVMARKYVGFTMVYSASNKYTTSKTTSEFKLTIPNVTGDITLVPVVLNDDANFVVGNTKQLFAVNTTETTAPSVSTITYHTFTSEADQALEVKTDENWWTNIKAIGQNKTVYLPIVQFSDDDTKLDIDVNYYVVSQDETIDDVLAKNRLNGYRSVSFTGVNNAVYRGKIVTDKVGTYYVVYTATDSAGNSTNIHFTFEVSATKKPAFNVAVTGDEFDLQNNTISCEAGSILNFEPTLKDANGKVVDFSYEPTNTVGEAYIEYEFENNGHAFRVVDGGYKFVEAGKYNIKITVVYNASASETNTFTYNKTIEVEAPKLKWDEYSGIVEYVDISSTTPVTLPTITATQKGYDVDVEVTVKRGDTKIDVNKVRVETTDGYEYVWQFMAESKGKYTVTYKAISTSGDTDTLPTFTITAGDNAAPKFNTFNNQAVLTQDIVYDTNSEDAIDYTIELNKTSKTLVITSKYKDKTLYTWKSYDDNDSTKKNTNFNIYEYDGSGVSSTNYSWSKLDVSLEESSIVTKGDETTEDGTIIKNYAIKGTGKVTLKFYIEDNYGNYEEKEIVFNVVSELEPSSISDTKLGIILVIISVVILAGVILFFALTGKKGGTSKSKPKKTEEVEETTSEENADKE